MNDNIFELIINNSLFAYISTSTKFDEDKTRNTIKKAFEEAYKGEENLLIDNFENNLKSNTDLKNLNITYNDIKYVCIDV